jgi:hypothetical protein
MKIKVLELPLWVSNDLDMDCSSGTLDREFDKIEPLFNRDGYYLINNKYIVIECTGRAWECKNQEGSVRAFYWELEDAEYEGINILSKAESDAIYTLMKIKLASEKQISIFRRDYSRRANNLTMKRMRDTF